ncbi:MAG: aminotransferase class IV family protein [Rickettsiales bacterium]|nr:aminotransferase class IV family protein [Rickettsiales bacterium]
MLIYYLNGKFINSDNCKISILDRGFKFGDGLFETISFENGCFFQLNAHLKRLKKGLSVLKINYDCSNLPDILNELVNKNNFNDGSLRITVTRGSESLGYMPKIDSVPNIAIEIRPKQVFDYLPKRLVISSYIKPSSNHYPIYLKTCQGLNSTLAIMEAKDKGYDEALILYDNYICETSSANIFFINNNVLITPSLKDNFLGGVTRRYILANTILICKEMDISLSDIEKFDYAFMTNSSYKLMPIQTISDQENNIVFNSKANNSYFDIKKKLNLTFT